MFIDNYGTKYLHIHLIEKETEEYMTGWYFSDEVDQLHGPFGTFEETIELHEKYVKEINVLLTIQSNTKTRVYNITNVAKSIYTIHTYFYCNGGLNLKK